MCDLSLIGMAPERAAQRRRVWATHAARDGVADAAADIANPFRGHNSAASGCNAWNAVSTEPTAPPETMGYPAADELQPGGPRPDRRGEGRPHRDPGSRRGRSPNPDLGRRGRRPRVHSDLEGRQLAVVPRGDGQPRGRTPRRRPEAHR